MAAASTSLSRRLCRAAAILWVVVLWVPALQMMFHPFPDRSSLAENRAKAPPPHVMGGRFGIRREFLGEFDRYFGDNFGFRDSLIRLHASLLYSVLRTSPTENVILGKEGWLYYNSPGDGSSIKDYCGLATIGAQDLRVIESNLTALASYLRARGVLFALVVGPSKHTIYPEHLPDAIRSLAGETRLDQLARLLAGHPEIIFVDPRRVLAAGKGWAQLYFKTDTHWNGAGAFLAYRELMRSLERAGAAVTVPREKDFRLEQKPPGVRDLGGMLGVQSPEKEGDLSLERLSASRYNLVGIPVAPGGNPARAAVTCETDAPDRPRLLMLHDSFGEHLKPLLCPDFSRSLFRWSFSVAAAAIDAERPAILVLEITERYLNQLKGGGLSRRVEPEPRLAARRGAEGACVSGPVPAAAADEAPGHRAGLRRHAAGEPRRGQQPVESRGHRPAREFADLLAPGVGFCPGCSAWSSASTSSPAASSRSLGLPASSLSARRSPAPTQGIPMSTSVATRGPGLQARELPRGGDDDIDLAERRLRVPESPDGEPPERRCPRPRTPRTPRPPDVPESPEILRVGVRGQVDVRGQAWHPVQHERHRPGDQERDPRVAQPARRNRSGSRDRRREWCQASRAPSPVRGRPSSGIMPALSARRGTPARREVAAAAQAAGLRSWRGTVVTTVTARSRNDESSSRICSRSPSNRWVFPSYSTP